MIEIIILIFLTRNIGKLAIQKGENPTKWKVITVVAWFVTEIVGANIATMIFNIRNFDQLMKDGVLFLKFTVFLYLFAVIGYHIVLTILKNKPDASASSN